MNKYFILEVDKSSEKQMTNTTSFIGGKPCIPENVNIPKCQLCDNEMTFYFQIAFPVDHIWSGMSMALFSCTKCHDDDFLIPEMLEGNALKNIEIPNGFLERYQKNFRTIIFPTKKGKIIEDYVAKIKFKKWNILKTDNVELNDNYIGSLPKWYLDDETPSKYHSEEMHFLMQLKEEMKFEIESDAPGQIKFNYLSDKFEERDDRYYELFLANYIYFFGTKNTANPSVYILTQI